MYFHTNIFLLTTKWDVMWVNYKSILFWLGFGVLSLQFVESFSEMQFGDTGLKDTVITNIQSQIQTQAYGFIQAEKSHNFNCFKWKIKKLFRKIPMKTASQNWIISMTSPPGIVHNKRPIILIRLKMKGYFIFLKELN